jgi:thiol:disulfide interchange protein DsbD
VIAQACVVLLALWAGLAYAVDPADLLEPEKAFRLTAHAVAPDRVQVDYAIADGYYLYRERFKFAAQPEAKLGTPQFPAGQVHQDAFFGRTETYRRSVAVQLPVSGNGGRAPERLNLSVTAQGCADVGVCYPPQVQTVSVDMLASAAGAAPGGAQLLGGAVKNGGGLFGSGTGSATVNAPLSADLTGDSDSAIAGMFDSSSLWVVMGSFFVFGLLLAFTPCVLPMLPILSGIIVGEGRQLGKGRAFVLSLVYVLGMAVTYAVAGVAAAYSGGLLAAALQNSWVLGAFALVFVWLALAMFGVHELQLPGFVHQRLGATHQRLAGGRVASVALMGVLSAVIVSPCVAAPLAGAILYIAQSRAVFEGGAALFVMALGMGVPLLVVGVSEGALMPRSGPWMETVKRFFGFVLLGVAIWIVSPLLPIVAQMMAWSALLIMGAIFMHAIDPLPATANAVARVFKAIGIFALLAGAAMFAGVLAGSRDPLRPLAGVLGSAAGAGVDAVKFERVKSLAELDARVKNAGQPVLLDFYADWCVTCKEMERWTFTDPSVKQRLAGMLVLQADVTANTSDDQALLKRFKLFGPPGIVFFDKRGREVINVRVIGYEKAEKFSKALDAVAGI